MSGGLSLSLLLRRSFLHRRSRTLAEVLALTVTAAVATALLTLYASLDRKLHSQFRAFGANIVITPVDAAPGVALPPDALAIARQVIRQTGHGEGRVVPFAYAVAQMPNGSPVVVAGTDLDGVRAMNSWWQVSAWPRDTASPSPASPLPVLTGVRAQQALGATDFTLTYNGKGLAMHTAGTLRTGDAEESRIYLPLHAFEAWTGSAPSMLQIQAVGSAAEIQAVLLRLRQAMPQVEVHAVHQLVDAEAHVVTRTRSLMLSSLVLISLTVAVCVLATLTASVLERRRDFAVMKALGATQGRVAALFLLESVALALAGLLLGYALGCAIAFLIGEWNFHTAIPPLLRILPEIALLNLTVAVLASLIPMRILRRLQPASLLRGE